MAFAKDGRLALRLQGAVRLAAVGIAPMMYENEDYLFKRTWWLAPPTQLDKSGFRPLRQ